MSEQLTFHNTNEQRDNGSQPTVLIERSRSGEILTATATGQHDAAGREFYLFTEDGEQKEKPLGRNSLSDQIQDKLAAELAADRASMTEYEGAAPRVLTDMGGSALRAAGVETPGVAAEHEKDTYDYLRTLLPPVTRPDKQASSYDYLFGTDEEQERALAELQLTRKEQEQQKYYDRFVTSENKQSSQVALAESLRVNPVLGNIFRDAGIAAISPEAVDAVRENADVRYEVAKYFVQKLETMVMKDPHGFGWRIEDNMLNNLKEDPQTGQKMMSRDYVVSLVLKMLGGEYSERHADDGFERDQSGRVVLGQHRDAARMIMNYNA